ncbi:hypothetical protein [Paratissierella segnis]|jgi:hypothetical protein|nr:hypothetical protein [Paratissierella segnis]
MKDDEIYISFLGKESVFNFSHLETIEKTIVGHSQLYVIGNN